jgi:hypothetical protein
MSFKYNISQPNNTVIDYNFGHAMIEIIESIVTR